MRRKCLSCGAEFKGRPDATLCAICAQKSKDSTHMRLRVCRQCGAEFYGGPRAWYCPDCRRIRQREADKRHRQHGTARPIGSTDICKICGKAYIVYSGNQKYCPDCAPEAVAEIKRKSSAEWNRSHIDYAQQKADRHAAAAQIPCAICGKPFIPSNGGPLTCSPACHKKYVQERQAEWEQSHQEERRSYQNKRYHAKIATMSPEELTDYRDSVNSRARTNYAERKKKQDK